LTSTARSSEARAASGHARAFAHAVGYTLGGGTPTPLPAEVLPPEKYHGSTDGLIILNLAHSALGVPAEVAVERLPEVWQRMHEYFASLSDDEAVAGIGVLPGVISTLRRLAGEDSIICGLVTGNVEGIARKKMRAVGILETGALAPPAPDQLEKVWAGEEGSAFLGGFGSDYCSGIIAEADRNHLDRGEQIAIAVRRCRTTLPEGTEVAKVVHVGDAPSDVLAARSCIGKLGCTVGVVGVATGRYSASLLRELAGEPETGVWEPYVLDEGLNDAEFLSIFGIQ